MTDTHILDAARDFRIGASMLEAHFGERVFPLRSTVVALAFSIELYLKYLSARATGQPAWGHDLTALYRALPGSIHDLIGRHYRRAAPIMAVLEANKTVFEDWRYIYEKQDSVFSLDFESLRALSAALDAATTELAAA